MRPQCTKFVLLVLLACIDTVVTARAAAALPREGSAPRGAAARLLASEGEQAAARSAVKGPSAAAIHSFATQV